MTPQSSNPHSETAAVPPNPAPDLQTTAPAVSALPVLAALGSPNGSSGRPSRAAKPERWNKRTRLFVSVLVAALVLGGTATAYVIIEKPFEKTFPNLVTAKVKRGTLPLTIVERGELVSANNSDIVCQIKAKSQGSTVATTIRWLVDDGTRVKYDRPKDEVKSAFVWDEKAGAYTVEKLSSSGLTRCVKVKDTKTGKRVYADLLMELDDSGLQDQLVTQRIALDGARDAELQAVEALSITLSQNTADIEKAEADVRVAEINLKKYMEGDYIAKLKDLEGKAKDAQAKVEQQVDRLAWANRMLKKHFQTPSQVQSEQLNLESLLLSLDNARENMRVLLHYEKAAQEIDLKAKVAKAKADLANVKHKAKSQEAKDRSSLSNKKSTHVQEQNRYKDILDQLRKCKVRAPRSGIAVYYIPQQARWGIGSRQSIVAQGESVSEGQKMIQIPDLEHMLVDTKVHEALAPRVHPGQEALVRVDSFSERPLKGKVDFIATVAAAANFLSSDVRVYKTMVRINESFEGLRPGSNAEVTITIGDAVTNALKVPVEAIVGGPELGESRKVFVLTPNGPQQRDVKIGKTNAEEVQILEGLEEGEDVVLNPKVLVGDKVKTRKSGEGVSGPEPGKGGPGQRGGRPGGPRRPGGPQGPGMRPGGGGAGFQMTPEMQKRSQELKARLRKAPKASRKAIFEQAVPEAFRGGAKQRLKAEGIDIPD